MDANKLFKVLKCVLSYFIKVLKSVLPYFILGFSFYSGFIDKDKVMVTAFLAFCLVFFISNFDKIAEIKASLSGLEIKAKNIVDKAQATIEQLRELAKKITTVQLALMVRSWGYPCDEMEQDKDTILKALTDLEISKEEQDAILDYDWNGEVLSRYVICITGGSLIPSNCSKVEHAEWQEMRNNPPSPHVIENFLVKIGCLTEERRELLEDYKYFIEHKKHRRRHIWNTLTDHSVQLKKVT